jgi:hypothetical protein
VIARDVWDDERITPNPLVSVDQCVELGLQPGDGDVCGNRLQSSLPEHRRCLVDICVVNSLGKFDALELLGTHLLENLW